MIDEFKSKFELINKSLNFLNFFHFNNLKFQFSSILWNSHNLRHHFLSSGKTICVYNVRHQKKIIKCEGENFHYIRKIIIISLTTPMWALCILESSVTAISHFIIATVYSNQMLPKKIFNPSLMKMKWEKL